MSVEQPLAPQPREAGGEAEPPAVTMRRGSVTRRVVAWGSYGLLGLLVLVAVVGHWFVQDPTAQDLAAAMRPPAWQDGAAAGHLLGTDTLGRDVLARVVVGLRSSLAVSGLGLVIAALIGVPVGMLSGYVGGLFDDVVMRLADVQLAIPAVLFVLTVATILQPSFTTIALVLGLSGWTLFARVARAQTLSLREREMVLAIRSLGAGHVWTLFRHVLPNIAGPLIVICALELAALVMAEAALGYLGLGVPPPTPTLGGMISAGQNELLAGAWWLVVVPGVAIALMILVINSVGDRLRDRLDPRVRRRLGSTARIQA